jgi:hypothetical protein
VPTRFARYQVPQEVGRVNAESPSFIVPVEERKDGIEAMFAKQSSKKDSHEDVAHLNEEKVKVSVSPASPTRKAKRERSESPIVLPSSSEIVSANDSKGPDPSSHKPKRPKVESHEPASPDRKNDEGYNKTENRTRQDIIDVDALEIDEALPSSSPIIPSSVGSCLTYF